jgi:hypothetical protein
MLEIKLFALLPGQCALFCGIMPARIRKYDAPTGANF